MHHNATNPIANSLLHSDTRHPADFIEPLDPDDPAREQAQEVLRRVFVWVASATGVRQYGLRAIVILYVVRRDLISGKSLEQIGEQCGCSKQAVSKLVEAFHTSTGY
jgi:hypothetical protein